MHLFCLHVKQEISAEARVRSRVSLIGIYGGRSGTGTGFNPSTLVFYCQFHSTAAPLLGKIKTIYSKTPTGCIFYL
jgi:hypothetical protein